METTDGHGRTRIRKERKTRMLTNLPERCRRTVLPACPEGRRAKVSSTVKTIGFHAPNRGCAASVQDRLEALSYRGHSSPRGVPRLHRSVLVPSPNRGQSRGGSEQARCLSYL